MSVDNWPVCVGCGTHLALVSSWSQTSDARLFLLRPGRWSCPMCKTDDHQAARLVSLPPKEEHPTLEQRVDALVAATEDDVLLAAADVVLDVRHELETILLALSRMSSELMRRVADDG